MQKKTAAAIYSILLENYPGLRESSATVARGTPFEVLILTILSAQTTDRAVLLVKKPLFYKYPSPAALAIAKTDDVEPIIHSLGYYHAKAQHIITAAQKLMIDFKGVVPETMDELLSLPGVGRKTANIVLYHGYKKNEGIAVDTHARRLAERIGFSGTDNTSVIERDLMALFLRDTWGDLTDVLITHGRACCTAKKPRCEQCPISHYCRYYMSSATAKEQTP